MIDLAIMIAVLGGGAVALRLLTKGDHREGDALWSTSARRVGGEVEVTPGSFLAGAERKIRLSVQGVAIVVETHLDAGGRSSARYTRIVTGALPVASGVRIHVEPRDIVRALSKRLGIGELPTGDASFDDAFHVSGAPRSLVLAFLDAPTRRRIEGAKCGFDIDGGALLVRCEGVPSEVGPLVEMTRLGAALVERWCAVVRGPRLLARSLGLALVEPAFALADIARCRVASGIHRTRPIALSVRLDGECALTVLSFDDAGTLDWTMERDESGAFTSVGEPPEAVRAFAVAAPTSLLGLRCVAETVELAFDGLAPDPHEVAESLDAILDAMTPVAPYR